MNLRPGVSSNCGGNDGIPNFVFLVAHCITPKTIAPDFFPSFFWLCHSRGNAKYAIVVALEICVTGETDGGSIYCCHREVMFFQMAWWAFHGVVHKNQEVAAIVKKT